MGVFQKFLRLDAATRFTLIRAYYRLGSARFMLATRPFKQIVAGLNIGHRPESQSHVDKALLDGALRIGWAVQTAARYTPWESSCLVQVLAAQRMLRQQGIAGSIFIGTVTGSSQQDSHTLSAHAWLKCGDQFITGESGHERFEVLSLFSW